MSLHLINYIFIYFIKIYIFLLFIGKRWKLFWKKKKNSQEKQ
jgi:hypothetical protein